MSAEGRAPAPIRVLELRAVTGQGGGPEKTLLNGAAQADPLRLAVTLCFMRRPNPEPLWVKARAAQLGVDYVEIVDRHPLEPKTWPTLLRLVRDRGIHIVHSHDYKANFYARLLARHAEVAAVATAHGWTGSTLRELLLYYPADRRLLAGFAKVIAVSGEIGNRLIDAGADARRIEVLLNGIAPSTTAPPGSTRDELRAEWGFTRGERVIGTVGRLERQKRVDLLIEAFVAVRRLHAEARLLIVGEGDLGAALRRQAESAGVASDCRFLGYRHDVDRVLTGIDLYVQSSAYEGSANAVLEAMLVGAPVVATAVGGTAELLTHGVHGLLVDPGDLPGLQSAIEAVWSDPEAAARRARAAQERARGELSFARRERRLLEIYEDVLAQTRGVLRGGAELYDGAPS